MDKSPWSRRTKIVATLGPATNTPEKIDALIEAGVNIFRLNFSHGTHEDHRKVAEIIRKAEEKAGRAIGIMGDLQGPKLRLGTFKDGAIDVHEGMSFRFDLDETPGDETRVCLPHPEVLNVLEENSQIFLDDGKVRALVTAKGADYIDVTIRSGAKLSNRKGLNVPGAVIPIPALTEKDKTDLVAALDMGVDWIAQSFVQTPEDVEEARALIDGRASLMVKLEKPSALNHLDEIVERADGVMLARGDLGVEIPPQNVPAVQKRVIRTVSRQGKPVIVATQMLESMIENARPTRAEASDVATAVYDGADGVMLSAETAAGAWPLEAVGMMDKICRSTELDEQYEEIIARMRPESRPTSSDAITTAACHVAQDIDASLIVTYTESGSTALRMARQRPDVPILCLTPRLGVARRMCMSYGVYAVHMKVEIQDLAGPAREAARIAQEQGIAKKGQTFVMTAGVPFGEVGTTNTLRIAEIS